MNLRRPRVHWVTNFAAPYRKPVWDDLSVDHDLRVHLIDKAASRDGQARAADWFEHADTPYPIVHDAGREISLAGRRMILAGPQQLSSSFTAGDILVLGGWEHPVYWQLLARAKRTRVRTIGFYESTQNDHRYTSGPVNAARAFYFRRLDGVVVPGAAAASALRRLNVPVDRIFQGFNAVDVDRFHNARRQSTRASSPRREFRFLFVGQLIERKNVGGLLTAFAQMRNEFDTLTIAGAGPLRQVLRDTAVELGIDAHVTFVGATDYQNMPALMGGHDCLVLPSHSEVWGLVVNEALAAGLHCVVSSKAGVAPDIVGMPGVFVADPVVESLRDKMDRSRREWAGPIVQPEILAHSPREFANTFRAAMHPAK